MDNTTLLTILAAIESPLFAVVDGAQIDNLQSMLFDARLTYRPLFLGDGDDDRIAAGPHLVTLPAQPARQEALEKLLEILGDKTYATVFWAGMMDFDALYRHLRTINMVYIPDTRPENEQDAEAGWARDSAADEEAVEDSESGMPSQKYERVLFRHADANVMAQVLPALDESQFARLMGPASQLVFEPSPEWGDGAKRALRPEGVIAPRGPLRFDPEAMTAIGNARIVHSRHRIMDYLRDVAPEMTQELSDQELERKTQTYMVEARGLGVRSEAAMGRWAYLQMITQGKLMQQNGIIEYMRKPGEVSQDRKIQLILQSVAVAAKKEMNKWPQV
jgi:hypothetical protein